MQNQFSGPVKQVLSLQCVVLLGVGMILFFLAQPSEGLGATAGLRLTTTIDKDYANSDFSEDRYLEVLVQAPRQMGQRMLPLPPPPPFGLAALFDPSGRFAKHLARELRQSPSPVARNMRVEVHIGRELWIDEVFAERFEIHGNTIILHGGQLAPGESRRFVIRLKTNPCRPGAYQVGRVKMSYTDQGRRVSRVQRLTLQYQERNHFSRSNDRHRRHYGRQGAPETVFRADFRRAPKKNRKMSQERYRDRRGGRH